MVDKSLVYQAANSEQTVHDFLCFSTAHNTNYHTRMLQQAGLHFVPYQHRTDRRR